MAWTDRLADLRECARSGTVQRLKLLLQAGLVVADLKVEVLVQCLLDVDNFGSGYTLTPERY
jgi:hypothetical protein